MTVPAPADLDQRSQYLRGLIVDSLEGGNRGHVGSAMSVVEILRVLYDDILRIDSSDPSSPERDRCILSKGHGCLGLYAVLADKGFFPFSALREQCRPGALLGGHPESSIPGVEASTGSLGHGLGIGLGMALAARMSGRPSRIFVVLGDGELDEGSVWEAALAAGKHKLENLVAIVDYNKLQSYGPVKEVLDLEPLADKWRAFNFGVRECAGHDPAALRSALLDIPFKPGHPSVLIAHTIKGRGVRYAEHNPNWHHKNSFSPDEATEMRASIFGK